MVSTRRAIALIISGMITSAGKKARPYRHFAICFCEKSTICTARLCRAPLKDAAAPPSNTETSYVKFEMSSALHVGASTTARLNSGNQSSSCHASSPGMISCESLRTATLKCTRLNRFACSSTSPCSWSKLSQLLRL
ncbi:hypothetical protein T484DRAFT_1962001 [Baffinella frigidus]|nr:hypothetical protein T484DRAFT_1962001 [Cryptophyta sp. CCMP2293]